MVQSAAVGEEHGGATSAGERPLIPVVPRAGIPIAGAVLAFVIIAIATNSLWMLTFCHVVGGGLWTAIDLFVGFVVGPIMGRMSIPARAEFSARFLPKMVIIMPTVVTATLAAGYQLALTVGNLNADSPNHSWLVVSFCVVGGDGGHCSRRARAGQRGSDLRDEQAHPGWTDHRAAHEALHVDRCNHWSDAGRDADHHDEGGLTMSDGHSRNTPPEDRVERRYPPVDVLATIALGLVIVGGIFMASFVPRHVPLILPVAVLSTAFILLFVAAVLLSRIEDFAWDKFRLVYKWALLAYVVEAGVIAFAFIRDHTHGVALLVLLGMLVVFAVSVPTTIAYTVARFAKGLDGKS